MSCHVPEPEMHALAQALAYACRRLHARGLLAGAEGNLSARLPGGDLLVTAAGVDKGAITAEQLLRVHADGTPCHNTHGASRDGDEATRDMRLRPSSELGMHVVCYASRPDVQAIVHAHPPVATGFATAGVPLPTDVLPEVPVVIGPIALVPYGRPGTPALAEAMGPYLADHMVFLLQNHGVTAMGRSVQDALLRMESTEQAARIVATARVLGGARVLPAGEADVLAALWRVQHRTL